MSTHARSTTAEMSTLKTVSIVLAFTAAIGMVLGTAGFTAMNADRGIEVSVVDDESAYLAANQTTDTVPSGTHTTVIELENRFGIDLDTVTVDDVRVAAENSNVTVEAFSGPKDHEGVEAGEAAPVTVTLSCTATESASVTLTFDVRASGDGVDLSTTYERDVTCEPETEPDAEAD